MKRDPCWTEAKELKIQFRELLQEIERERLNHLKYVEEKCAELPLQPNSHPIDLVITWPHWMKNRRMPFEN